METLNPQLQQRMETKLGARSDLVDLLTKSGVALLLKLVGGLAAFILTLVAGRLLGTTGSGLFFLCLAIVTVVSAVSRLGLDQAITRFVAEAQSRQDWDGINGLYIRSIFAVLFASSTLALVCFALAAQVCNGIFGEPELLPVFRWMSLSIPGCAATWIHAHFFQGVGAVKRFQVFQNFGLTLCFLLILWSAIFFAEASKTAETFSSCFFSASLVTAVFAHWMWRRTPGFERRGTNEVWKSLIPTLLPFWGIIVLQLLSTWLPQIVLGALRPVEEVGIYNAAFRVANLTSLVLLGVNSVVLPRFAALDAVGEYGRMRRLAQSSTRIMTIACLPFLGALLCFPEWILSLFGSEFTQGSVALRIVALGQLVNVATGSVGGLLNMTGHQSSVFRCTLVAFFVMSAQLAILTPLYGSTGAAIAQSTSLFLQMILLSIICYQRLHFTPIKLWGFR